MSAFGSVWPCVEPMLNQASQAKSSQAKPSQATTPALYIGSMLDIQARIRVLAVYDQHPLFVQVKKISNCFG
jgi:hypothetical protein